MNTDFQYNFTNFALLGNNSKQYRSGTNNARILSCFQNTLDMFGDHQNVHALHNVLFFLYLI